MFYINAKPSEHCHTKKKKKKKSFSYPVNRNKSVFKKQIDNVINKLKV